MGSNQSTFLYQVQAMTHILAVSGSPRPQGNSSLLLDEFLRGAQAGGATGEKVIINQLDFRPCQGCGACSKDGICILKDDMQEVHRKVQQASGIVLGFPIHFGSLSSQTKMMIDRFQPFWAAKHELNKPRIREEEQKKGFIICVEGSPVKKFCRNARDIVQVFFDICNIQGTGYLCYSEVRSTPPAMKADQESKREVFQAGCRFAGELKKP